MVTQRFGHRHKGLVTRRSPGPSAAADYCSTGLRVPAEEVFHAVLTPEMRRQ